MSIAGKDLAKYICDNFRVSGIYLMQMLFHYLNDIPGFTNLEYLNVMFTFIQFH